MITPAKASEYDLLIGMDDWNIADLKRLVYPEDLPKVKKLLSYTGQTRDIADPWYTGNFDETFDDVMDSCTKLLESL